MPSARSKYQLLRNPMTMHSWDCFVNQKDWWQSSIAYKSKPEQSVKCSVSLLQLMREAETHLGQLLNMLRAPGVATLPGAVAIVAVKAAGSIAQQRPFFMNKVLPVLIALGSAQVGLPPFALQCFDGGV